MAEKKAAAVKPAKPRVRKPKAEPKPAPVEAPIEAPENPEDKLAQLAAIVIELVSQPDAGDGLHAHYQNIERAVGGLHDAKRAWANITNSADSVRNKEE